MAMKGGGSWARRGGFHGHEEGLHGHERGVSGGSRSSRGDPLTSDTMSQARRTSATSAGDFTHRCRCRNTAGERSSPLAWPSASGGSVRRRGAAPAPALSKNHGAPPPSTSDTAWKRGQGRDTGGSWRQAVVYLCASGRPRESTPAVLCVSAGRDTQHLGHGLNKAG